MTKGDVAEVLSADLLPWERQPREPEAAYAAFQAYLHQDKRVVGEHGRSARNWSSQWHWSHRAHEYDVYMSRVDLEDQVRYRRKMNERHRQMASVAQAKLVQWLNRLDEQAIARMSAAEATRLWDVAVRIERAATLTISEDDVPELASEPYGDPARKNSLKQRLIDAGLDQVEMTALAHFLHELEHWEPNFRADPQAAFEEKLEAVRRRFVQSQDSPVAVSEPQPPPAQPAPVNVPAEVDEEDEPEVDPMAASRAIFGQDSWMRPYIPPPGPPVRKVR
jgi:hypothetical protein